MANMICSSRMSSLRSVQPAILLPLPNGGVFLAGLPVLTTTEEAEALADALLSAMALPQKAALDALHIGLAAANGIEVLLTWNCAHIANPFMLPHINAACVEFGVIPPTICAPLQLIEA